VGSWLHAPCRVRETRESVSGLVRTQRQVGVLAKMMLGQVVKVQREEIAACMTCPLCNKLFRDATTISECLHTCESLSLSLSHSLLCVLIFFYFVIFDVVSLFCFVSCCGRLIISSRNLCIIFYCSELSLVYCFNWLFLWYGEEWNAVLWSCFFFILFSWSFFAQWIGSSILKLRKRLKFDW